MNLPKVALLGYKDFIDLTKGIIKNLKYNISIDVYQCFLDECLKVLPELEKQETDIIITGRANKTFLEKMTNIPIITFRITPIDILSAIKKAHSHSNYIAIAMANFEKLEYDYTILHDILNVNLQFISYSTEQELKQKIKQFSRTNGVIIGTSIAVSLAKQFGLEGILIYSLKNSILESIDHALEMIDLKRNEEKHSTEFKAIINTVSDGILAINENNKISLINKSAQKLLSVNNRDFQGKNLSSVFSNSILGNLTQSDELHDKIVRFNNNTLNVNQTPIIVKGNKLGKVITFQDITKIQKIEQKYRSEIETQGLIAKTHFKDIICASQSMKKTLEKAKRYSQADSTVLIIGETGTGKELLAQSIHNYSKRKEHPFVAVNCAALPESLLESELFGYEGGSFTGAKKKGKKGLFELAHNGTIFLDEINSVSLHFQAKLLRVLQEKEVVRIGSGKVIPINIRIIAASNEDLINLVNKKSFRADLYYRLNVLKIHIPPLRNRLEDIPPLAKQFIYENNKGLHDAIQNNFEELCEELMKYDYPGNIRELHNILERFTVLYEPEAVEGPSYFQNLLRECVEEQYLDRSNLKQNITVPIRDNYRDSIIEAEKAILKKYVDMFNGDKSTLAKMLGISRTTLYRKLKELNLNN